MTKPDDIPQDVWDLACKHTDRGELTYQEVLETVALVVLADRGGSGRDIYAEAIEAALARHEGTPMEVWDAANKLSAAIAEDSGWTPSADVFDQIAAALMGVGNTERLRMAKDWCNFCEAIGVDIDTHEAVAAQIKAMFEP